MVHVYDLNGHRRLRAADLAAAKEKLEARWARRQYFSTWNDQTGERCERKGGEWRQLTPPNVGDYAPADEPAEQWWQR